MSETTPRVSTASGAAGAAPHDGTAYAFEEEPSSSSVSARAGLLEVLRRELLGPAEGDTEVLTTQPSQRYLLGRIAPTRLQNAAETPAAETSEDGEGIDPLDAAASTGVPVTGSEEDTLSATVDEDPGEDTDDEPVRRGLMIPASMGLRFQVPAGLDALNVHVSWGTYEPTGAGAATGQASADTGTRYQRVPHEHSLRLTPAALTPGRTEDRILDGDVTLRIDSHLDEPAGRYLIELALCNDRTTPRRIPTEAWMFQTRIDVDAGGRAVFLPVHDPTLPPAPGTAARPIPPLSSNTSHSTVGLPRESRISRAKISIMALMHSAPKVSWLKKRRLTRQNGKIIPETGELETQPGKQPLLTKPIFGH